MICKKCLKDKKQTEFYKRKNGTYRLSCKECIKKHVLNKYRNNPDKKREYAREYYHKTKEEFKEKKALRSKKYYIKNRDKILAYAKEWRKTERGKEVAEKAIKKWRESNREKIKAHWAVKSAVKSGKIIKPKFCSKCGKECLTNAHHYKGYDKKNYLTIKWLCNQCHKEEHI